MNAKDFLTKYNEKKGYETDDLSLMETLVDVGECVDSKDGVGHRWYDEKIQVNELDGAYIQFINYYMTGDACMGDMDLEYDISTAKFVEKKTRSIVETYYE